MRHLKKLCVAGLLTLALTLPAFAGEMEAGVIAPPPSTQQASAQGEMPGGVTGEMQAGLTGDMSTGFTDPTTDFFLNLFQGLMSLF
ncbi:MAG TPA: hypothetical protein VJT09_01565 [Pyrinomonadaceae bacterium]|nr:hypothetical protein [Pyrinomonadaceae bacterium]